MKTLAVWLANGFGLGLSPVASGTVGTLLGIPLAYLVFLCPVTWAHIVSCALLVALAVVVSDVAEKHYREQGGKKDDGRIVADEYMLLPIVFIGLPMTWQMVVIGFLTARFFDILKPWPARGLQSVKGGMGIVLDDLFASFYALAANHAIYWALCRFGWL